MTRSGLRPHDLHSERDPAAAALRLPRQDRPVGQIDLQAAGRASPRQRRRPRTEAMRPFCRRRVQRTPQTRTAITASAAAIAAPPRSATAALPIRAPDGSRSGTIAIGRRSRLPVSTGRRSQVSPDEVAAFTKSRQSAPSLARRTRLPLRVLGRLLSLLRIGLRGRLLCDERGAPFQPGAALMRSHGDEGSGGAPWQP